MEALLLAHGLHLPFRRPTQKVVRPGEECEPLFGVAAHLGFILEIYYHIYDHYLVCFFYKNVVDFFFTCPMFCIIST
jgi:hypothetical protein